MAEGTVKWFSEKKGFGFIAQDRVWTERASDYPV